MTEAEPDIGLLLDRAARGDQRSFALLFEQFRERLTRMITLRLDRRLAGRVDAADIIQDTYLQAFKRFPEFVANFRQSFYLWLRLIAGQVLVDLHRHHLGTRMRSVSVEVSLSQQAYPQTDSNSLAALILGKLTSASRAAMRAESRKMVRSALESMSELDREILTLRHFEMLSNEEAATVVGLSKSATSNRYIRALKRLKDIITDDAS